MKQKVANPKSVKNNDRPPILDAHCLDRESGQLDRKGRRVLAKFLRQHLGIRERLPAHFLFVAEQDVVVVGALAGGPGSNLAGLGEQHDGCRRFGHLAALKGRLALARGEINHVCHDRD